MTQIVHYVFKCGLCGNYTTNNPVMLENHWRDAHGVMVQIDVRWRR